MDPLLKLLRENASYRPDQLAKMLQLDEAEVVGRIKDYEADGTIVGYRTIINEEKINIERVRAVIEVKITPEREGGFNHLASRIAKHSEVRACYLMSGSYDLLAIVEGDSLKQVASFVSDKLSTLQGVLSTSTHFMLKPYKEHGVLLHRDESDQKLQVSP
ncbi:MAG TPA: AsnC family transcriptional regulator [Verrucomicrobiales bacterium]|nr:AsnC family transcriptional regulator [Pedosphaera sp.]MBL6841952.1 Lrp/AsnC family transcriptional regulator [Verrucomicrobiae bacterium]MDA7670466.1 Lrp/AsnC family transcriptional regulator [Verrucomicrobiota bacterium]RZO69345.1 MAG: Lrp/AsnC family transcriptional regulator [Limisphaerales bacterium]HAO66405.1 AsnC family transcriptional regulator [Verrucomicrobiales bacterium]|tara:strand:+ start:1662 stop:2141 length:480 start_codon:yes stop_codon:yes gene_type:complete